MLIDAWNFLRRGGELKFCALLLYRGNPSHVWDHTLLCLWALNSSTWAVNTHVCPQGLLSLMELMYRVTMPTFGFTTWIININIHVFNVHRSLTVCENCFLILRTTVHVNMIEQAISSFETAILLLLYSCIMDVWHWLLVIISSQMKNTFLSTHFHTLTLLCRLLIVLYDTQAL